MKYSKPQLTKSLRRLRERSMIATMKATRGIFITILKYDYYQDPKNYEGNDEETVKEMRRKQVGITKNKNEKNEIIEEKLNKFNFRKSLLELGIDKKIVSDWLIVRKGKKAVNTETAFEAIMLQIQISGKTANECIKIASENSWSGFKAKWLENLSNSNNVVNKKQLSSQVDLSKMNYNIKP